MPKLPPSFYLREDVDAISRDLLGKYLFTRINGSVTSGMIVETEAYRGPHDKACHAYNYRRTKRTEVMYLPGGHAYVYLCYGIHSLFNVVTHQQDEPFAVLVRAVEPTEGVELMLERRGKQKAERSLTGGPGALSAALGITTELTGAKLRDDRIWIEDRGVEISKKAIIASPRVGVQYAGADAELPLRFRVKDSQWTSPAK